MMRKYMRVYALAMLAAVFLSAGPAYSREITARAVCIMDGDRILFARNPAMRQPPASTTKLVTAMVAIDSLPLDKVITISRNAASTESVGPALKEGDRFTVRQLLHLALIKSLNGAAIALAEAVSGSEDDFSELMNKKAAAIGAHDTKYINASGLPGKGQYITAYDLALIMQKALEYPLIAEIIGIRNKMITSQDGRSVFVSNTNKLLWSDKDFLGGKTGYTRAARHCLAFAAEKGDTTFVAAILGDSSRKDLWRSAEKVLDRGYDIMINDKAPVIETGDKDNASGSKIVRARAVGKVKRVSRLTKNGNKISRHRISGQKHYGKKHYGRNGRALKRVPVASSKKHGGIEAERRKHGRIEAERRMAMSKLRSL
jgi:D-alanyl-D-alanine carboxypeptidase (penicillin-binding protein 5/6)